VLSYALSACVFIAHSPFMRVKLAVEYVCVCVCVCV
jgi:hypothetical protein